MIWTSRAALGAGINQMKSRIEPDNEQYPPYTLILPCATTVSDAGKGSVSRDPSEDDRSFAHTLSMPLSTENQIRQ
jgi:hypothetical protein